jgi:hypothetical protein
MSKTATKPRSKAAAKGLADAEAWLKVAPPPGRARVCLACADERLAAFVERACARIADGSVNTTYRALHAHVVQAYGYSATTSALVQHIKAHVTGAR